MFVSWLLVWDFLFGLFLMVVEEVFRNFLSDGSIGFFFRVFFWSCLFCCDFMILINNFKVLVIGFRGVVDGGRGINVGVDNVVSE